jgi:hypothetical protein
VALLKTRMVYTLSVVQLTYEIYRALARIFVSSLQLLSGYISVMGNES